MKICRWIGTDRPVYPVAGLERPALGPVDLASSINQEKRQRLLGGHGNLVGERRFHPIVPCISIYSVHRYLVLAVILGHTVIHEYLS